MTALRDRLNRIEAEHTLTVTTSDTLERNATTVVLRCSCKADLPGTVVADQEAAAADGLVKTYLSTWYRLQMLSHRMDVLLAEDGWIHTTLAADDLARLEAEA